MVRSNSSKNTIKWLGVGFAYLLIITFLTPTPVIHAASFTAVQNGDWDDSATWGGTVPTANDDAVIPDGITVTIPEGLTVERNMVPSTTLTQIDGELINAGSLNIHGQVSIEGFLTNNGALTVGLAYNVGYLINHGTIMVYGLLENNVGGHITNRGTITTGGGSLYNHHVMDNFGYIINNSAFMNYGTLQNFCEMVASGNPIQGNPPYNIPLAIAPPLIAPTHRTHTTDSTIPFYWDSVNNALSYRIMIYTEDRLFILKQRVFPPNEYTPTTPLAPNKYFWRVRTQDGHCDTWSAWSKRYTLFME